MMSLMQGSVHYSTGGPLSVTGVKVDVSLFPAVHSGACCGSLIEKLTWERDKLREEADELYKDNITLQSQTNALLRRCELAEKRLSSVSETVQSTIKGVILGSELEPGSGSESKKTEDNKCFSDRSTDTSEDKLHSQSNPDVDAASMISTLNVYEKEKGIPNKHDMHAQALLADQEHLEMKFEQALMLADIWKTRWSSCNEERERMEQRLSVLSKGNTDEYIMWDVDPEADQIQVPESTRRVETCSRFQQEMCQMKECKNCRRFFEEDMEGGDLCLYHPQRPLSMSGWLTLFPEVDEGYIQMYENCRFWPCCDQLARKTPKGCKVGQHQI